MSIKPQSPAQLIESQINNGTLAVVTRNNSGVTSVYRLQITQDLQDTCRALFARCALPYDPQECELIDNYSPFSELDDNQVFALDISDLGDDELPVVPEAILKAIANPESCELYTENVASSQVKAVAWIVNATNPKDGLAIFQSVDTAHVPENRIKISIFNDNTFHRLASPTIILREEAHAVIWNEKLIFSKTTLVKRFLNLTDHIMRVTDNQVNSFFQQSQFAGFVNIVPAHLDQWVRRRVASINNKKIQIDVAYLAVVAQNFNVVLSIDTSTHPPRINLPSNKAELKRILRLIDEDYFTSWNNVNYQASGKRSL